MIPRIQTETLSLWHTHGRKDGIEQTINGDTILHTNPKGEVWTLEAYTFDGSQSALVSVSTTIRNTPPSITRVETTTDTPNAASHISIDNIEAEDADGDSISLEIHWYQDGAHRSEFRNDYIIPTEHIQKGQLWEASITPHDGEEEGEEYIQTFTVQNTEPEIISVQITPQDAFESSVHCAH